MIAKRSLLPFMALALAAVLSGCVQKNTGDEPAPSNSPSGLNRFLMFPNPIAQNTGGFETNTTDYALAYYAAIDPTNAKSTLAGWQTLNGFGSGTGTELRAVFRDVKDLGYGRNMNGRLNADGSIAFFVENYNVGYSSSVNVDVAIARDKMWHVGTNAIEWSTTPCINTTNGASFNFDRPNCVGTVKFAKFYNFSSADGTRQLAVDLDGNGLKAMPGPCITCHGGRGDPLTPKDASTNLPRFPLVENSVSRKRGDTQGRLQGMNVDSFQFSTQPGWTRGDQEATLKTFNQWILRTYPLPAGSPSDPTVDGSRVAAGANEWQGTAAEMIKSWYGGTGTNGMPNAVFADNYIPSLWNTGATIPNTTPPLTDQMLYRQVVAPFCRTCHNVRGTKNQDDIDFMTLGKFQGYGDRIKGHVFDRGTMPLALIVYNDFWNSAAPDTLASFVDSVPNAGQATSSNGSALRPGRPIADPGPPRMVKSATSATLSAENSLFAATFQWSSNTVSIINPNSMIATFPPSPAGSYTVTLTVGNGTAMDTKDVLITVDSNFPDPATLKFAHVKNVLQNTGTCATNCHKPPAVPPTVPTPPIFYNATFDQDASGAVNATDDDWLFKAVTGRVNLTEIQASPLLRKPSGHHHNGGTLLDVTDPASGGGLSNYSILYNWILAGMPAGGVAANPVVNAAVNPAVETFSGAFGGPFTSPSIAMDGSQSLAPTGVVLTYLWSIASQPPGGNAVIANPTSATPTMTVKNVGDYVAQLQVSGGGFTDTAQRKFTVNETPFTADFTPADGGSGAVTFSGGRGDLLLQSVTSALSVVPENPVSCSWTVLSGPGVLSPGVGAPGGPLLDGSSSLVATKDCIGFVTICIFSCFNIPVPAFANLNVASSALNQNYVVQFTASTVTSKTVTHTIKVAENPPVPSIVVGGTSVTFTGSPPFAQISLSGSSTGIAPLTFAWSIDSAPAGAVVASSVTGGASTSTLTARATGSYTVRLTVTDSQGGVGATTSTFSVTPARGTTFSTMTGLFGSLGCTGCHATGNPAAADPANNSGTLANGLRPSWQNVNDVNGKTLWQRVFQRVVSGNPGRSLILLNPENSTGASGDNPIATGFGTPHGGGCYTGFGCDASGSANATTFSNWILDGGPPGN